MTLADTEFAQLTDFQCDTVDYVLEQFFGDNPTTRFLVADEVGMGKTLVARGVIAGTIDRLRRPESHVDRIDILYVCSNANIARQNIAKLDVLREGTMPMTTRITMLARHTGDLNRKRADGCKIVNLIAFTPGTSFQKGHTGGMVQERALLAHFTAPLFRGEPRRNALRRLLRGRVGEERWARELQKVREAAPPPDRAIGKHYRQLLQASPLERRLRRLVDRAIRPGRLSAEVKEAATAAVGDMRHLLARASVDALQPDLVILDEFQRFRHLLVEPAAGEESEVSALAHDLFKYKDARVLLLSATPYKLFTLPEEQALTGDDHYRDFHATVGFLAYPHGREIVAELAAALSGFRDRLIAGDDPRSDRDRAQEILRTVMCRTERPTLGEANLLHERSGDVASPTENDLVAFVQTKRLARMVEGEMSVDYWKSAPYFLSFMDGYQLSRRVRERIGDPDVKAAVNAAPKIRPADVRKGRRIDPANARLRALQAEVFGSELQRLLWMPPSMPYHRPRGAYEGVSATGATKRLIFSSWAAAPSSIAALLSHEALRSLGGAGEETSSPRLVYDVGTGQPGHMSTLLLTVPQPGLARLCDPLELARSTPGDVLSADDLVSAAEVRVRSGDSRSSSRSRGGARDTWYWHAPLTWSAHVEGYAELLSSMSDVGGAGLRRHLAVADQALAGDVQLGSQPRDLTRWIALTALASPANCTWRALHRVTDGRGEYSPAAILTSAVKIGEGFRTLFNRPEVMNLVDKYGSSEARAYWQRVLEYCLSGNLQAVLDEYLHHLVGNSNPKDDHELIELAESVAGIVAFGRGRVEAFNPRSPDKRIPISTRFALRFGNARGALAKDEDAVERAGDVQASFNSPFWPFVLASTSVGQEGVDFHWWCHSLVHWNQPANVVDLEQREGRVHRFKGHAVRKNVGAAHRADALRSAVTDPWIAAFAAAAQKRPPEMNDLWPSWVYPGEARVECWVPYMPLSKDRAREERLRRDRALYRLAFGQPRQEDLLAVLEARGVEPSVLQELRIDLRPPGAPANV